jgi:signal peptidase I
MCLCFKLACLPLQAATVEHFFSRTPGFVPRLLSERHRLYQAQSGLTHRPKRLWGRACLSKFLFALAAKGAIWRLKQCGIFQRTGSGTMSVKTGVTEENRESSAFDLAIVLLEAVAIAIVIRIFLFQPFNIPSGSMIPTLLVGDYLFVSKYSYGYSKYSFPFGLNLFNGRVLFSEPHRGDVIVFKTPKDNSTDFIKRLVGLPGDKIQMIEGVLNINGVPVKRERVEDRVEDVKCRYQIEHMAVHQYRETLPNGKSYLTQKLSETCQFDRNETADNTEVFVVPPKHYFMMGDNRDDSADSRFHIGNGVGYVPEENLVGRARLLFFSIDEVSASWFAPWRWPFEIRWSRIGNVIR